jgi:glycine betaine/proline transport system substrate-binding protein
MRPKLTEFFSKVSLPLAVVDETLARMEATGHDVAAMAQWFLKHKSELWTKWVPADVARRVQAAL